MKHLTALLGLIALITLPLLALAAEGTDFVPLTNIPVLFDTGNAINTPEGLSIFLNNIYKVCIGVAAVIAVLQIMRAGIMYMGGDSVTEKKDAKNLIAMSIGGLILVLSPVIVFSIINPEILSLEIGGIKELEVSDRPLNVDVDVETRDSTAWQSSTIDRQAQKAICESQGRTMEFSCRNAEGVERKVPETEACASGETNVNRCLYKPDEQPLSCAANLSRVRIFPRSCPVENGYEQVPKTCCSSLSESDTRTCCGSTDGRGPDDPSVTSFYGQKTYQSEALARTYAQACSNIRTHDTLVTGREGNVKRLPVPTGGTVTPYLGQCFSFSVEFGEFQIWENSTEKMVKYGDLTFGDKRYSNFKNGCEDDGGQVQYRNALRTSFTAEQCRRLGVNVEGVFSQYPGTSSETHSLLCRTEAHVCKR